MKSYFPLILFVCSRGILQTDSTHYNLVIIPDSYFQLTVVLNMQTLNLQTSSMVIDSTTLPVDLMWPCSHVEQVFIKDCFVVYIADLADHMVVCVRASFKSLEIGAQKSVLVKLQYLTCMIDLCVLCWRVQGKGIVIKQFNTIPIYGNTYQYKSKYMYAFNQHGYDAPSVAKLLFDILRNITTY